MNPDVHRKLGREWIRPTEDTPSSLLTKTDHIPGTAEFSMDSWRATMAIVSYSLYFKFFLALPFSVDK